MTALRNCQFGRFLGLLVLLLLASTPELSAQCWSPNFTPGMIYKTTGDLSLDQKFNNEGALIYRVFGVNPNMVVFDDGGHPNAFASPQITLPGSMGTVFFGVGLIRDQLWSMDNGEAALAGIMAHEFSHILQMRMGSTLSGKYRELHADFMAGYYLRMKSYVARADIEPFAHSLFQTGDYNFRDPSHHGTPEERVSAMKAGFNTTSSLDQAFLVGQRLVLSDHRGDAEESESAGRNSEDVGRPISGQTSSDNFAEVLNSLVEMSKTGFGHLRGSLDPDSEGEAWNATTLLPGADECEVWIYKDKSMGQRYECVMEQNPDLDAAKEHFERLVGKVTQALPGWTASDGSTSRLRQAQKEFQKGTGPTVYVEIFGTGTRRPYQVRVLIDTPDRD